MLVWIALEFDGANLIIAGIFTAEESAEDAAAKYESKLPISTATVIGPILLNTLLLGDKADNQPIEFVLAEYGMVNNDFFYENQYVVESDLDKYYRGEYQ